MPAVSRATRSATWRSAPTARSTPAAATARASTSPTTGRTATRSTRAATRRRRGRRMTPPTAEGGALRSQDLRTAGDPTGARRRDPARRTRTPARRCPTTRRRERRPERAPDHRLRPAQPVPLHVPARARTSLYVGDVGWNAWEEIDRIAEPRRAGRELRLAVLRGRRPPGGYDSAQPEPLREPLRGRRRCASRRRYYTYNHAAKVVPDETCPTGGSSISGLAFYNGGDLPGRSTTARCSSPTTRADCIWVMFPDANGLPDPATRQPFVDDAQRPGRPPDRPRRRPLLRRPRRRHDPAHPLRSPATSAPAPHATATPTSGAAAAARWTSTATASTRPGRRHARPTPGTSTATAPTTTRPPSRRRFTYTDGRGLHGPAAGHRPRVASTSTDTVTITAGDAADRHDRHAHRRHHVEGRRRHLLLGLAPPTRRTARPAAAS